MDNSSPEAPGAATGPDASAGSRAAAGSSAPTAVVVGRDTRAARAALELASAGATVRLATSEEWLLPGEAGPLDTPDLLRAASHPRIELITGARIAAVQSAERGSDGAGAGRPLVVSVEQLPRFIDPTLCTACGACADVCPVTIPVGDGSAHKAVYRGGVPTTYAIDKLGTAPCRDACPIHQRAQGYTALVRSGRFDAAYGTILRDNPFPSVCGRVCNRSCEESCSRATVDAAVNVMAIKRFVADWALENDVSAASYAPARAETTGKRVAIVGSGPAGLTCARDLVRLGHDVVVYEALPLAGGMMSVGVPEYRLPAARVQREVSDILAEGVELVLGHRVADVPALLDDGFDAVFVAVGAHTGIKLPIPGSDLPEVDLATDFLRDVKIELGESVPTGAQPGPSAPRLRQRLEGRRVLVLGGGNVAIDAAMTSVRLGAEWVGMSCLESRERMPAHAWEVRDAEDEGVEVYPSRTFKEVTDRDGHVAGVRCVEVDFRGFVDGRPDFDELPGTEELIPADIVIFAIGQVPDASCLGDQVELARGRFAVVDRETQATNVPGVFAGGDLVTGTSFIVDAIAAGHRAAESIDCHVRGEDLAVTLTSRRMPAVKLTEEDVRARLASGLVADVGRAEEAKRPAMERTLDFCEVCAGLTADEARAEAARCLSCGFCSECLRCTDACPAGAIDHLRQPRSMRLAADAVLWTADPAELTDPGSVTGMGLPHVAAARASADLPAAVDQTRASLGLPCPMPEELVGAPSRWLAAPPAASVGVFLCRCGGELERAMDLDAVAERLAEIPQVDLVQRVDFACQPEGAAVIRSALDSGSLSAGVLAACSCCSLDQICYSCTTQRMRCKDQLGVFSALAGLPIEFANVREQCAFVHPDDLPSATAKAGDLIAGAIGASLAPLPRDGRAVSYSASSTFNPSLVPIQRSSTRTNGSGAAGAGIDSAATHSAITAVVDPVRCRACEDCAVACGLEAIRVGSRDGARMALVDPAACLGCGICMAACPAGAIMASDTIDAEAEARLVAMGDLSGRTVVFTCNWGAYSALEAAGRDRLAYPSSTRVVRLMCAGRLSPGLVMRAFQRGAERVTVLTCGHTADGSLCRYESGNDRAHDSVEQTRSLLALLGLDPGRLTVAQMLPGDTDLLLAALRPAAEVGAGVAESGGVEGRGT